MRGLLTGAKGTPFHEGDGALRSVDVVGEESVVRAEESRAWGVYVFVCVLCVRRGMHHGVLSSGHACRRKEEGRLQRT